MLKNVCEKHYLWSMEKERIKQNRNNVFIYH